MNHTPLKASLLILFGAFSIMSCEKLINDVPPRKLPEVEHKLVIAGIIAPQDSLIAIYASISTPIFGEPDTNIYNPNPEGSFYQANYGGLQNADVYISDGSNELRLVYNKGLDKYTYPNNGFIQPGKTYYLRAKYKDYECSSETTVPKNNTTLNDFSYSSALKTYNDNDIHQYLESEINIQWNDIKGEDNIYSIRASVVYTDSILQYNNQGQAPTKSFVKKEEPFYGAIYSFFDDDSDEINKFEVKATSHIIAFRYNFGAIEKSNPEVKRVYVEIRNVTKSYYDFQTTKNQIRDNPFAEPSPIYSNIDGGLGFFSASNNSLAIFNIANGTIVE